MIDAQQIHKTICTSVLPEGPCGITVEDIQRRIDGFQGPYRYPAQYSFHVCAPFVYKKQALFDKYLAEQRNKR